jgi:ankyrin repeat protein
MMRKFNIYLICLLLTNYCLANPVDENDKHDSHHQESKTSIFRGSHVLEYEESSQERTTRLGSQLLTQVELGHLKQCLQLLWLGASVTTRDQDGNTALHHAAMGNTYAHCKMAVYLLACGADPKSANNDGYNPIHYAAHCPTMLNIFIQAAR